MKYGNYRMQFRNSSLEDITNAYANLGDNIQAIALDYIYKQIGIDEKNITYIGKDDTRDYKGEYIILPSYINLWDNSLDLRLPMSPYIYPIFISVVANRDIFIDRPDLIHYFSKYSPVGCRDEKTLMIFRKYGIESYLMGCISLCLPHRKTEPSDYKVFLVDTSEELEKYIPNEIKSHSEYLSHAIKYREYPITEEEDDRLKGIAKKILRKYSEEASLVVTSRLHAAVPCIAMGIPVIFASNNIDFRFGWLDKYIKLYAYEDYGSIDWNQKPLNIEHEKSLIVSYIKNSIANVLDKRRELFELSEYYENREHTIFLKDFRHKIELLREKYDSNSNFKYIIWGAGMHCYYAYELINNIFPSSKLQAIVDKYQTGEKLGVKIIKKNDMDSILFDHVFITTAPGKDEALAKMENLFGSEANKHYTILISQQKS